MHNLVVDMLLLNVMVDGVRKRWSSILLRILQSKYRICKHRQKRIKSFIIRLVIYRFQQTIIHCYLFSRQYRIVWTMSSMKAMIGAKPTIQGIHAGLNGRGFGCEWVHVGRNHMRHTNTYSGFRFHVWMMHLSMGLVCRGIYHKQVTLFLSIKVSRGHFLAVWVTTWWWWACWLKLLSKINGSKGNY